MYRSPWRAPWATLPWADGTGFCRSPAATPRSFLPTAHPNLNCEHPPPMGPQFPAPSPSCAPVAPACASFTHHTPPNRASWVPAPPPWARGSVRSCPRLLDMSTRHCSCLSVPHDMLHIYTLPGGEADPGAWHENEGWRHWSQLSPWSCPLLGKPGTFYVHWAKGSCSWKSVR